MILTSEIRSFQMSSRLRFYSIPLLEKEEERVSYWAFFPHFLGTQLAQMIL